MSGGGFLVSVCWLTATPNPDASLSPVVQGVAMNPEAAAKFKLFEVRCEEYANVVGSAFCTCVRFDSRCVCITGVSEAWWPQQEEEQQQQQQTDNTADSTQSYYLLSRT